MKKWVFIPLIIAILLFAGALSSLAQVPEKVIKSPLNSFKPGEELNYRVIWNNIAAAKMTLLTDSKMEDQTYRVEIKIDTIGAVRNLAPVNDRFIAYVQPNTGLPVRSEREIHEGAKSEKLKITYNQEKKTVTLINENQSAPQTVSVVPATHDIASLIWALRDLNTKDKGSTRLQLFNASTKKISIIEVTAGNSEIIETRKGKVEAQQLIVQLQDGKEVTDKFAIRVWLSNDASHVPVLITAQPPFGKVRVELLPSQNEDVREEP